MNKQEAIEKIKNLEGLTILDKTINFDNEMIPKKEVFNIINQIDEQEKPVVPLFVAEWLEVCKENLGFSLSTAMSHSTSAINRQPNWVKGWFNFKDNQETFAKAWLFGYEVEKEKLYTVELPNNGGYYHIVLVRNAIGEIKLVNTENVNWRESDYAQLTKTEIKENFDWAWQFAKEVEE